MTLKFNKVFAVVKLQVPA